MENDYVTPEREAELFEMWVSETNDPETAEWRDGMTPGEAAVVDAWDKKFAEDIVRIARKIQEADARRKDMDKPSRDRSDGR